MAAAPETDAEASARSVAGQTVERTDSRLYHRRCRWSCGQARWIDPALTSIMESEAWRRRERSLRGAEIHQRGGGPTGRLWTPEAGALVITSGAGGVKTQSFPGNRWAVLPGVERLRKWPKFAFHWGTAALHRESQSPCCQAIMGQLSIGAGFHTFLRRAAFSRRRRFAALPAAESLRFGFESSGVAFDVGSECFTAGFFVVPEDV